MQVTTHNRYGTAGAPAICIGMPVYNTAQFIRPTIEAMLGQSWRDFELIISDNASTDDSLRICEQFSRDDPRVSIIRQENNLGAPANYRAVLAASRSPYFKWASRNDLINDTFLEACIATLESRLDCIVAYPRTQLLHSGLETAEIYPQDLDLEVDDPVLRFQTIHQRLRLNNILNGVIRRSALAGVTSMPDFLGGDVLLMAELALAGKFIEVPAATFYRRMEQMSATPLQTDEQKVRHFYPTRSRKQLFGQWKKCAYGTCSVFRQPLTAMERVRGVVFVFRLCRWSFRELVRDVIEAGHYAWRWTTMRLGENRT